MRILTTAEHQEIVEAIETILVEAEENEDISQPAIDRLYFALQTLGVKHDEES